MLPDRQELERSSAMSQAGIKGRTRTATLVRSHQQVDWRDRKSHCCRVQLAADDGAILLIDEADTFLRDRDRAHHGWEFSHVNELFTQMERFAGVPVMCTNRYHQLHAAALRRSDNKGTLDYLSADQQLALFEECVQPYGIAGTVLQQQLAR